MAHTIFHDLAAKAAANLIGAGGLQISALPDASGGHASCRIQFVRAGLSAEACLQLRMTLRLVDAEQLQVPSPEPAGTPVILLTPAVGRATGECLRRKEIQFLDGNGNAYINLPGVYIWTIGNRSNTRNTPFQVEGKPLRAFNSTGMRLLFLLLTSPDAVINTYRELAERVGISLGAVNWIMGDLRKLGFIVERAGAPPVLVDRKRLLDRWVLAYRENLFPKLLLGWYQRSKQDAWQTVSFTPGDACWGGEYAAELLTQAIQAVTGILYVGDNRNRIMAMNGLRPCDGARENAIQLAHTFWLDRDLHQTITAPPLVIYADLMNSTNSRNWETAQILYDRHLKSVIEHA